MQPHAPYFGHKAEQLRQRLSDDGIRFWAWDENLSKGETDETVMSHLLSAAQNRYITADELTEVYIENVELVVEYAKKNYSQRLGEKRL